MYVKNDVYVCLSKKQKAQFDKIESLERFVLNDEQIKEINDFRLLLIELFDHDEKMQSFCKGLWVR